MAASMHGMECGHVAWGHQDVLCACRVDQCQGKVAAFAMGPWGFWLTQNGMGTAGGEVHMLAFPGACSLHHVGACTERREHADVFDF